MEHRSLNGFIVDVARDDALRRRVDSAMKRVDRVIASGELRLSLPLDATVVGAIAIVPTLLAIRAFETKLTE